MSYTLGTKVRLTATFTVSGVPTDPTVVTFKLKTPAGVVTTYLYGTDAEVVKSSTGVYYSDVTLSQDGVWRYRWSATGLLTAAFEDDVVAQESRF